MDSTQAIRVAVEALYDAADDDSATGGPDPVRKLWPVVYTVDSTGAHRVAESVLETIALQIIAERTGAGMEA